MINQFIYNLPLAKKKTIKTINQPFYYTKLNYKIADKYTAYLFFNIDTIKYSHLLSLYIPYYFRIKYTDLMTTLQDSIYTIITKELNNEVTLKKIKELTAAMLLESNRFKSINVEYNSFMYLYTQSMLAHIDHTTNIPRDAKVIKAINKITNRLKVKPLPKEQPKFRKMSKKFKRMYSYKYKSMFKRFRYSNFTLFKQKAKITKRIRRKMNVYKFKYKHRRNKRIKPSYNFYKNWKWRKDINISKLRSKRNFYTKLTISNKITLTNKKNLIILYYIRKHLKKIKSFMNLNTNQKSYIWKFIRCNLKKNKIQVKINNLLQLPTVGISYMLVQQILLLLMIGQETFKHSKRLKVLLNVYILLKRINNKVPYAIIAKHLKRLRRKPKLRKLITSVYAYINQNN